MTLDQIALALAALNLAGEDWGPDWSSYAALAAGWRGGVAVPSEAALLAALPAAQARADALAAIATLENQITPRRMRDAVLTPEGSDWLAAQEAAIAVHRATLAGGG